MIDSGPFTGLPRRHFRVIVADPPWRFVTRTVAGGAKSPERHYRTLSLAQIKALPVEELAARDAALFLWVTKPKLAQIAGVARTPVYEALGVMQSWGFAFRSVFLTWVKTTRHGAWHRGPGYWSAGNPEQCWVGVRGRPRLNRSPAARKVEELLLAPVREHSRKPDEALARIEAKLPGPYLELFSRSDRPGWTSWGDQAGLFSNR